MPRSWIIISFYSCSWGELEGLELELEMELEMELGRQLAIIPFSPHRAPGINHPQRYVIGDIYTVPYRLIHTTSASSAKPIHLIHRPSTSEVQLREMAIIIIIAISSTDHRATFLTQ